MSDPRFRETARWRAGLLSACDAAAAKVDALGDRGALVSTGRRLLAEDSPTEPDLRPELPDSLVTREVGRFVDGEIDLQAEAWWLIYVALAEIAISGAPSSERIARASRRLHRAPQWVNEGFVATCIALINGAAAPVREAWLADLERPLEVVRAPEAASAVVRVSRRENDWQVRDPFEVWRNPPIALEAVNDHVPATILRRLAPDRWLRAVERWRDAPLVTGALFGAHIFQDRDALLRWLAAAEPVFDEAGKWTGKLAAVILTQHVVRAAEMLLHAVAEEARAERAEERSDLTYPVDDLQRSELPAFFRDAWLVLLARSDGVVVAAALHAELVDPSGGKSATSRDVTEIARNTLGEALKEIGLRSDTIRDLWQRRRKIREEARLGARVGYASGICALVSALEVTRLRGEVCDDDLMSLFVDRLTEPDPDWGWLVHRDTLTKTLEPIVTEIARRPDAFARVEQAYESLESVRRRGEYGRTYIKNDTDLPSVLALVVLLGLIDELHPRRPEAAESLRRCLPWARRLTLTSSPAFEPTINPEGVFAFAVGLCTKLAPDLVAGALEVARPNPALAAIVVASLLRVMSQEEVDMLLLETGQSIESVRADALAWADVTGRPTDVTAALNLSDQES